VQIMIKTSMTNDELCKTMAKLHVRLYKPVIDGVENDDLIDALNELLNHRETIENIKEFVNP